MAKTTETTNKIKMIARNPITRKVEEVHPEDEVSVNSMIPMFLGGDQKYYTIPGIEAADVYDEWFLQS